MSYESVKKSKSKKVEKNGIVTMVTPKERSRKAERSEDLSKNHSKSIRYRLRVQQESEAENEIKEYRDDSIDEQYYERD